MWSNHHTLITDASKELIWKVWADVGLPPAMNNLVRLAKGRDTHG